MDATKSTIPAYKHTTPAAWEIAKPVVDGSLTVACPGKPLFFPLYVGYNNTKIERMIEEYRKARKSISSDKKKEGLQKKFDVQFAKANRKQKPTPIFCW